MPYCWQNLYISHGKGVIFQPIGRADLPATTRELPT